MFLLRLILRLAVGVSVMACLCLGAAKVWGVNFNHSLILMYGAAESAQFPPQYVIMLVDVERNLFSKLNLQNINPIFPTCSINGQVAFVSLKGGMRQYTAGVYVMSIFDEELVQVFPDWQETALPSWSPDGQYLAFLTYSRADTSLYSDIYVTTLSSGNPQPLTWQQLVLESPVWSPDGTQLSFVSALGETSEVYTVSLNGNPHRLTNNEATEKGVAWSPDGNFITFSSTKGVNSDIYVMDTDGSNLRQLTQDSASETFPAWSPAGNRITFIQRSQRDRVYVMDVDGKNQHLLAAPAPGNHPLVWSPDGRYLIVVSDNLDNAETKIYLVNANGDNYRLLARTGMGFRSFGWCP